MWIHTHYIALYTFVFCRKTKENFFMKLEKSQRFISEIVSKVETK